MYHIVVLFGSLFVLFGTLITIVCGSKQFIKGACFGGTLFCFGTYLLASQQWLIVEIILFLIGCFLAYFWGSNHTSDNTPRNTPPPTSGGTA